MKKLFTLLSAASLALLLSACGGGGGGGSSSSTPPSGAQSPALPSQTAANQVQAGAACGPASLTPSALETWLSNARAGGSVVADDRGVVCVRAALNNAAAQLLALGNSATRQLAVTMSASAGYTGTVLSFVRAEGAVSEQQCYDKLDALAGGLMRFGQAQDIGGAAATGSGPGFDCVMIAAAKQGAGDAGQVPVAGALPRYHVYAAGLTPDSAGPQIVLSLLTRNSADRCATGNGCYPVVRSISVSSADPVQVVTFASEVSSSLPLPTLSGVQVPVPQEPLSETGGLLRLMGTSVATCGATCTLTVVYEDDLGQEQTLAVTFDNNGEEI